IRALRSAPWPTRSRSPARPRDAADTPTLAMTPSLVSSRTPLQVPRAAHPAEQSGGFETLADLVAPRQFLGDLLADFRGAREKLGRAHRRPHPPGEEVRRHVLKKRGVDPRFEVPP